jgi:hypothetical protein
MVRLTVPAELLEWLSTRTRDPAITLLDPYRDAVLEAGLQSHWLRVLREVGEQSIAERRRHHEEHSHLPRAPDARTAASSATCVPSLRSPSRAAPASAPSVIDATPRRAGDPGIRTGVGGSGPVLPSPSRSMASIATV